MDEPRVSLLTRSGEQPDGASRQRRCAVYGRLGGGGPDAVEIADGHSSGESGDGKIVGAVVFGQYDHWPHRAEVQFFRRSVFGGWAGSGAADRRAVRGTAVSA